MEDIKLIKGFLTKDFTEKCFDWLLTNIKWHEELCSTIDNSMIKINRKMAYVYDKPIVYSYAKLSFEGEIWNEYLVEIRNKLNDEIGGSYNSVLLNLYKDGKDEIKWHSDKEEIIGPNPIIACINLGATRKFWFRKKEVGSEKFFIEVSDGDLLIMGENCQTNYLHAILKEKNVLNSRISLTYRKVII